jgi:hypothetical protein
MLYVFRSFAWIGIIVYLVGMSYLFGRFMYDSFQFMDKMSNTERRVK